MGQGESARGEGCTERVSATIGRGDLEDSVADAIMAGASRGDGTGTSGGGVATAGTGAVGIGGTTSLRTDITLTGVVADLVFAVRFCVREGVLAGDERFGLPFGGEAGGAALVSRRDLRRVARAKTEAIAAAGMDLRTERAAIPAGLALPARSRGSDVEAFTPDPAGARAASGAFSMIGLRICGTA